MITLGADTIAKLDVEHRQRYQLNPDQLNTVNYPLESRRIGIAHFGVGGFHRAHQALYIDRLFSGEGHQDDNDGVETEPWAICGIGLLPGDSAMRDALTSQDGLYTLLTRAADGTESARVIGSIAEYLHAPENPQAVLEKLSIPEVWIVSLTVTEGGYNYDPSTGEFRFDTPDIAADIAADFSDPQEFPRTVFGYLGEALARRRTAAVEPFTILSCDNVRGNGDLARSMLLAYLGAKDQELADWVAQNVAFPNSMVDRITPVTTDADREHLRERYGIADQWPVVSEDYLQWVIEDRFPSGRPAFERVGAQLVDDVEPYELMKLRLLNCSHQAIAYFGLLLGYHYAHEAITDEDLGHFTRELYMRQEGQPAVGDVPGVDLNQYQNTLMERFSNAAIKDTLARLAAESSDRIPTWLVPVIRHQLSSAGSVRYSAAIVASWARYAEGLGESGEEFPVTDRLRDQVMEAASKQKQDPLAFLRQENLFGDLIDDAEFIDAYQQALHILHDDGARALLKHLRET